MRLGALESSAAKDGEARSDLTPAGSEMWFGCPVMPSSSNVRICAVGCQNHWAVSSSTAYGVNFVFEHER